MKRDASSGRRRVGLAVAGVAVAAALVLAAALYGRPSGDRAAPAAATTNAREAVMTVTAAELVGVELARTLTLNGSIHAWQEVIIAPEVGGYRVAEVFVDVGDTVKRGQKLVELSTALLSAEVATKQAALKQREAELLNTEAELKRGEALSSMNVLSEADLDRLKSESLAAQARLESARADLETSQLRLQFTRVTAPDDGVITSRTVTVGQIAQAGTEMLRLLRNGRIEWRGEVPEVRLGSLHAGQSVIVTTPDGTELAGAIRVVAPTITDAQPHRPRLRRPCCRRAHSAGHVRPRRDRDRPRDGLHGAAAERGERGRVQLRIRAARRQHRRAPACRDRRRARRRDRGGCRHRKRRDDRRAEARAFSRTAIS